MNQKILFEEIKKKRSYLCVGLDVDLDKIPKHLLSDSDPIFSFCKKIIDSTARFAVAYKPNIAFFESYGSDGWKSLERLSDYLSINYPSIFTIADAKRADIGNTASRYAKAFFEKLSFDAVTVSPYMGRDSVEPFLNYKDKFAIVLTLTSNVGSEDFQMKVEAGSDLWLVDKIKEQWIEQTNPQIGDTIGIFGGVANLWLSQSYKYSEVSLVTPLKYLALVFAIIFGYFIWDEIPTYKTLLGALLVIVSSIIIFRLSLIHI